ncbi:hypothetical protein UFOVP347_7 [uncultured Caudovirales phage]|uniref:Uncharacterized protein n=1 Tax=uncultured Caudovirales phage TaxID=2100421 RepID=A0A6J5LXJ5_9CAUD|nr:hypothetical protein UFOVP347_7 [uncultured Caudovirales phage]
MTTITTTFERRTMEDGTVEHVAARPSGHTRNMDQESRLDAIRIAYAMGREDERRQTAAVLRGLMAQ